MNNLKDEFENKTRISELSLLQKLGEYQIILITSYFEHYLYEKKFEINFD